VRWFHVSAKWMVLGFVHWSCLWLDVPLGANMRHESVPLSITHKSPLRKSVIARRHDEAICQVTSYALLKISRDSAFIEQLLAV
jgi:hypothetical protein